MTNGRRKNDLDHTVVAMAVVEMVACTRAVGQAWRVNVHGMSSDARGRLLHNAANIEAKQAHALAELLFPGLREYETKAALRTALLTRVRTPVEQDIPSVHPVMSHQPG
ncbi:hypothetical protein [Fodinicola acaciae]|uniref:hypothetical protein n=1 Tax=Fodinicola acaciae TaxID=2681555 RepID=UPI0013D5A378|nr:hypothetical protein [Fodinicola acaciae]